MDVFASHFESDLAGLRRAGAQVDSGVLSGRKIADALLAQIADARQLLAERGIDPKLAVVRVGDDPASEIYVRHKIRACQEIGIASEHIHLPADIDQSALLARLEQLNDDPQVNGILLQLPLSEHHDAHEAIVLIAPQKDVDGFHPGNLGFLMAGRAELEPCTPRGIMTMLSAAGVDIKGKEAVVVGRSMIVGRPMVQMLMRCHATVTACHRHTQTLDDHIRRADIVVVATGVAELIKGDWVKPGAVIVDVGMNRDDEGKLIGDVEFDAARQRAQLITPVPGGVGPMTVATLLENTIRASCAQNNLAIRCGQVYEGVDAVWGPVS